MATAVTAGMVVSVLAAAWGATKQRASIATTTLASQLAQELMQEAMSKPYSDPDGSPLLGIELGELTPSRTTFDDVDDYDGYRENSVIGLDGKAIVGAEAYKRQVRVKWVSTTDGTTEVGAESGLKHITVTVYKGSVQVAKAEGLRSQSWELVKP